MLSHYKDSARQLKTRLNCNGAKLHHRCHRHLGLSQPMDPFICILCSSCLWPFAEGVSCLFLGRPALVQDWTGLQTSSLGIQHVSVQLMVRWIVRESIPICFPNVYFFIFSLNPLKPYVYIAGCGNGSHLLRVLSLVQELVSDNSCDTAALSATWSFGATQTVKVMSNESAFFFFFMKPLTLWDCYSKSLEPPSRRTSLDWDAAPWNLAAGDLLRSLLIYTVKISWIFSRDCANEIIPSQETPDSCSNSHLKTSVLTVGTSTGHKERLCWIFLPRVLILYMFCRTQCRLSEIFTDLNAPAVT